MPKQNEARSYFDVARTLTGLTLREAAEALKVDFPQTAIKKREGSGGDLSSINTYHEIERLNDVFGLCGVGWGFEVKCMTEHNAEVIVSNVDLFFSFRKIVEDGTGHIIETSRPISAVGQGKVRKGMSRGDAEKSAITDALTKAASLLGVGLSVFKGEQTHSSRPASRESKQRQAQQKADRQAQPRPDGCLPDFNRPDSDPTVWVPFEANKKTLAKSVVYIIDGQEVLFPKTHIKRVRQNPDNDRWEVEVTEWIAQAKIEDGKLDPAMLPTDGRMPYEDDPPPPGDNDVPF